MLEIKWLEGPAKGCIDVIPDWVLPPSHPTVLVHTGSYADESQYLAKCVVSPGSEFIDFDYLQFADFNNKYELYVGVMRLITNDGKVIHAKWLENGVDTKLKSSLNYLPQLDIALPARKNLSLTETKQITTARIGQGEFRRSLQLEFNGCCALTGISLDAALRASHIKAWALCENDDERLDPANGLLLAAHVDALFDRYLISFADDGQLLWNSRVSADDRQRLSLPVALTHPLSNERKVYLAQHRKVFFG